MTSLNSIKLPSSAVHTNTINLNISCNILYANEMLLLINLVLLHVTQIFKEI